jgi:RNA polymerase sigma-70 factor, ECF subfamily
VQLFEHFAPRVKGYMMKSVRDAGRADDLTQEVLLRVWRKAHTYDPNRAAVSTWIFTIARSVMIDAIRKLKRPEPNEDDEAFVPSAPPPPDRAADLARQQGRVRDAMATLPVEQSSILKSVYFEGKSLRLISEEHNIPLGTVKSRVRLAFSRLRTALAGEEVE